MVCITKSDSCGIQTRNLLIRSQMLYSVELRSLNRKCGAKVVFLFRFTKHLSLFFSIIHLVLSALRYESKSATMKQLPPIKMVSEGDDAAMALLYAAGTLGNAVPCRP